MNPTPDGPQNPYAPPVAPSASLAAAAPAARGPIPGSVLVALIATGATVLIGLVTGLFNLAGGRQEIVSIARDLIIGGLILAGMVRGHRLAWQWGRIVGVLYLIFIVVAALGLAAELPKTGGAGMVALAISAILGACMLVTVIALSTPSAFAHFRLVCPQCQRRTTAAADFLFQKAKCKRCNLTFG